MIKIITIEREYGCGGGEIAQQLAERLGWKLWDQLLTEEIARLANCPKAVVADAGRNGPTRFTTGSSNRSCAAAMKAASMRTGSTWSTAKAFCGSPSVWCEHAAASGNSVIVGRGSQHFLRDRHDTLRVFLYAPREEKVRRLMARGKTEKEAQQRVDTVDRERADFIQKYFHVEWPDRSIYHAMINTAIGDESVIYMIMDLMKSLDAKVTA